MPCLSQKVLLWKLGLGSAGYLWKLNKLIIVVLILGLFFSSESKFGIKEERKMNIGIVLTI